MFPPRSPRTWAAIPMRAIRTPDFLYIRNYRPDRWPSGTPDWRHAVLEGGWYADTDNGPTKTYIVDNRDRDPIHQRSYELCFAKRPPEELYDLSSDPGQLVNVADRAAYARTLDALSAQLTAELAASGDPRHVASLAFDFDGQPYIGGCPAHPDYASFKKRHTPPAGGSGTAGGRTAP